MKPARIEQLRQIVADNYQEIAEQFSATRQKPLWPRLRQILRQLPISGRLLDIGCGNGRLLEELKKRPIDCYVGLDNSTELLKIAAQRYPPIAWPFSISWQPGDLLTHRPDNHLILSVVLPLYIIYPVAPIASWRPKTCAAGSNQLVI